MKTSNNTRSLAIIGTGPTAIYVLRHVFDYLRILRKDIGQILLFEKEPIMGMGMPYSPLTTDIYNLANITSEEIPPLNESFAEWLRRHPKDVLGKYGLANTEIDEKEVYSRLALGAYFHSQYEVLLGKLKESGIVVHEFPSVEIRDIIPDEEGLTLLSAVGGSYDAHKVVIATGHVWKGEDSPERNFFASPWPILKILPEESTSYNFPVGILGASLSAFDVVSSLSHRHGKFSKKNGKVIFESFEGSENFKVILHDANGWLPHLQYEQAEPMRRIYRHVDRAGLLALLNNKGELRIHTFFDKVFRPALLAALLKDELTSLAVSLEEPDFGMEEFVEKMSERHEYSNAFEGMKKEMVLAEDSVENNKPIHWKEVTDDLMYCLNFHAELMPAEDHLFFHKTIMPFLMNVIAALPLSSGKKLLALHDAGKLELKSGKVEILEDQPSGESTRIRLGNGKGSRTHDYRMFICCGGESSMELADYPFPTLVKLGAVRPARAGIADKKEFDQFAKVPDKRLLEDGNRCYYLTGGIDIDAAYRVIGENGEPSENIFDVSFAHSTGIRPYSYGLQACSATAKIMAGRWARAIETGPKVQGNAGEVMKEYLDNPDY